MQTYKFNLYRAAKFVRSVRAHSVPDAVAMIPEFTDAKIHGEWTSAHQWFGLEALELIIDIEATNAQPIDTKCPATADVTGGSMLATSIRNKCHTPGAFAQSHGAIDAPEWLPIGSTCPWGTLVDLRDCC
ncbi:MAG: hypothetical protein RJA63_29 [Pseudomonadota bacterium]